MVRTVKRPMTSAEQARFRSFFPNLNVQAARVTDNASSVYNCIAWSLGFTDRWLWPGSTISDFDALYRGFGFLRRSDGPIAVWGHSLSAMTHGSVSGPAHGPRWESKCGADLRIQHALPELVGGLYGRVVAFYRRTRGTDRAQPKSRELSQLDADKTVKLTPSQRKALGVEIDRISPPLRQRFEEAFQAWKESWFRGGMALSSDPHTRTVGHEFERLVALGPGIIPLIVAKLAEPDNFLALQLYDAIQPDAHLLVQYLPNDERVAEGEQGRARRVIQAWLTNR